MEDPARPQPGQAGNDAGTHPLYHANNQLNRAVLTTADAQTAVNLAITGTKPARELGVALDQITNTRRHLDTAEKAIHNHLRGNPGGAA